MYLCGDTVYAPPHIGHARSKVCFDVLRRWLACCGYDVVFCRNITDIDDKIIAAARTENVPWWQVAQRNHNEMIRAYEAIGCLPPTVEPRATGHIPEMIALIRRLISTGHAYASGGDVYFDVRSFPTYGSLSGQRTDQMAPAEQAGRPKHDPLDFALWKGARPGEPWWEAPWGPGRPGWHLECSAMAMTYLGGTFDIHGGGLDLLFPHHENELAQSKAAGEGCARYWLHNGLVSLGEQKMSKSLGNVLLVSEMVKRVRPVELRYYLAAPHYRSSIFYSGEALEEAATAYRRLESFVTRAAGLAGDGEPARVTLPGEFATALNDDLGTPQALAVLHGVARRGNSALTAGDKKTVTRALGEVRAMLGVLGLDPLSEQWASQRAGEGLRPLVNALAGLALEQRQAARERKDYAAADAIRARLIKAGLTVEDTPSGTRWELPG
jgi:cysteinyl-tRNA synthetase